MNRQQALEIIIGAKTDNKYQANIKRVQTDLSGLDKTAANMAKSFAALAGSYLSVSAINKSLDVAANAQKQFLRLTQLVEQTGGAAGFTAAELDKLARTEALNTLGDTTGVRDAIGVLLTFKSVSGDVFERSIGLASDMSEVFGTSLTSGATMLGKALESPVEGITALTRVGVTFTKEQKDQVKALVAANDTLGAQGLILQALEGQIGGAAKAAATGLAGAYDTLGQRVEELQEQIGNVFMDSAITGLNAVSDALLYATDKIPEFQGQLADAYEYITTASEGWTDALTLVSSGYSEIGGGVDSLYQDMFARDFAGFWRDVGAEIMHLPSGIKTLGVVIAAEGNYWYEVIAGSFEKAWLHTQKGGVGALGIIGAAVDGLRVSIGAMQDNIVASFQNIITSAANMARSPLADMMGLGGASGQLDALRDSLNYLKGAHAQALNASQANAAARAAVAEGYKTEIAAVNARVEAAGDERIAIAQLAIADHNGALAKSAAAAQSSKYRRETDAAIDAIEQENAALFGFGKALEEPTKNIPALLHENQKLSKSADQAKQAVESLWAALAKETATLGLDDAAKKTHDLAEKMRAAGASEQDIRLKTKEYEAQLRLNKAFEEQLKIDEDLAKSHQDRIKKSHEFIANLQEQLDLIGLSSDAERARFLALRDITPELQQQAAALYDQVNAARQLSADISAMADNMRKGFVDALAGMNDFFRSIRQGTDNWQGSVGDWANSLQRGAAALSIARPGERTGVNIAGVDVANINGSLIQSALQDFMPSFADSFDGLGAGFDHVIDGLGGMSNAMGYASAALNLVQGGLSTENILSSAGMAIGTYFGGPIGASIGQAIGGMLAGFEGGETRSGGAYRLTGEGEFSKIQGPSGGDIAGDQVRSAIEATGAGINALLSRVGASARLTDFTAALETSDNGRGGVWAGGTLSTGQSFGEQFSGQNAFEQRGNFTPEQALEAFMLDLQQSTIQALQAADVPSWLQEMLAGIDAELLNFADSARVLAQVEQFSAVVPALENVGVAAGNVSAQLIASAGGVDALTISTLLFYEQFADTNSRAQQQMSALSMGLAQEFDRLGVSVPASRAQFRALVSSIDTTTSAGQELFGSLMRAVPALDLFYASLEGFFDLDAEGLGQRFMEAIYQSASPQEAGNRIANEFANTFYQTMIGSVMNTIAQSVMSGVVQPFLNSSAAAAMQIQTGGAAGGAAVAQGGQIAGDMLSGIVSQARASISAMAQILSDPDMQDAMADIQSMFTDIGGAAFDAFQPMMPAMNSAATSINNFTNNASNSFTQSASSFSQMAETMKKKASNLLDYVRALSLGAGSTEKLSTQLEIAASAYESALKGEDEREIMSATDAYRDIAKRVFGDSSMYAEIDRRTRDDLSEISNRFADASMNLATMRSAPPVNYGNAWHGYEEIKYGDEDVADALGLPKLANGGIVHSSTLALIGERETEVVAPLSKIGSLGGGDVAAAMREMIKKLELLEQQLAAQRQTNQLLIEQIRNDNANANMLAEAVKAPARALSVNFA